MTGEQIHQVSRDIVQCLVKIANYEDGINRIVKNDKLFIDATMTVRLNGIRNNIWTEISGDEAVYILKKRIASEKIILAAHEKKISK